MNGILSEVVSRDEGADRPAQLLCLSVSHRWNPLSFDRFLMAARVVKNVRLRSTFGVVVWSGVSRLGKEVESHSVLKYFLRFGRSVMCHENAKMGNAL